MPDVRARDDEDEQRDEPEDRHGTRTLNPEASMSGRTDAPIRSIRVGMFVSKLPLRSSRARRPPAPRDTRFEPPGDDHIGITVATQRIHEERQEDLRVTEQPRSRGREDAHDGVSHPVEQDAFRGRGT